MGPTASGKTAIAIALTKVLPLEIISVDSAQIYKGMNIGTAKPDAQTCLETPHHLLNILEPTESYSVAQFCKDATTAMQEVTLRGKVPLLVGGTMLYFSALLKGLSDLPERDEALRIKIDERARRAGWQTLHAELEKVDPTTAEKIHPADAQRIQRALEVYYLTGQPLSALQTKRDVPSTYRFIQVGLIPSDRTVLHKRIAARFQSMLDQGLIKEVEALRKAYALNANLPSMRSVGYRQVWQYLQGEVDASLLSEKAIAATRQLAKRQLTWLRGMKIQEFDCLKPAVEKEVEAYLKKELHHA